MIQINSIFGYGIALFLLVTGMHVGVRTHYLLTPPSDVTVAVSKSLLENPDEWEMGSVDTILTNEKRGLEIQMFGDAGSIQVSKGDELVPTLDKNMNMFFSSANQNYLRRAITLWKEHTAPSREARIISEIEYRQ